MYKPSFSSIESPEVVHNSTDQLFKVPVSPAKKSAIKIVQSPCESNPLNADNASAGAYVAPIPVRPQSIAGAPSSNSTTILSTLPQLPIHVFTSVVPFG